MDTGRTGEAGEVLGDLEEAAGALVAGGVVAGVKGGEDARAEEAGAEAAAGDGDADVGERAELGEVVAELGGVAEPGLPGLGEALGARGDVGGLAGAEGRGGGGEGAEEGAGVGACRVRGGRVGVLRRGGEGEGEGEGGEEEWHGDGSAFAPYLSAATAEVAGCAEAGCVRRGLGGCASMREQKVRRGLGAYATDAPLRSQLCRVHQHRGGFPRS